MADEQGNGHKKKKPAQVEPKLKNMKSVAVLEGKKAVLKCEPRAGQTITRLKWYKDGKEFAGKNKPKNVKIKVKNSSEVRFRKAKVSDTGLYTCEAINDLGKASTSANLTVIKAATSTTAPVRTSSHEKQCSEKHKDYCVNGGTCFTIEIAPDVHRQLCRCPNEFTGDRCQNYVMASFYRGKYPACELSSCRNGELCQLCNRRLLCFYRGILRWRLTGDTAVSLKIKEHSGVIWGSGDINSLLPSFPVVKANRLSISWDKPWAVEDIRTAAYAVQMC